MNDAARFARMLASGAPIVEPVAVVVAHPDDETLWAGSALPRMSQALLIHLTDGAPADMTDAGRLGLTRDAYRAVRAEEIDRALVELGATPDRRSYGIVDQQTVASLDAIVDRLTRDLAGKIAVITHPYEGGHPDHDTAALAVRLAVDALARSGEAPAIIEFASYHAIAGERRFGAFWPDRDCPEQVGAPTTAERERVGRAIRAHRSQTSIINGWVPDAERWRAAPRYDFTRPPPPGESLYDGFGWAITSELWRAQAQRSPAGVLACA